MSLTLMGKKRGMVQLFDERGDSVPCTVIEVEPNVVVQLKWIASDGYCAAQLGFEKIRAKSDYTREQRVKEPQRGHFAKGEIEPRRHLGESRLSPEELEKLSVGQEIGLEAFAEFTHVDVTAISKGKGFQGTMKLHNFKGGAASHGCSRSHRLAGSTGMRSTPGRCLPGGKRASQMGRRKKTIQNLRIVKVIPEQGLLLLRGGVPGSIGSLVRISPAVKRGQAPIL